MTISSDWLLVAGITIGIIQTLALTTTLVLVYILLRQEAQNNRHDRRILTETLRNRVHTELLARLDSLNRIMLDYPDAVTRLFSGFEQMAADEVRQYCYVYAVLDLLNYLVLHFDAVDPYIRDHLKNLGMLLFLEPKMQAIFLESRDDQSRALLDYLEQEVLPLVRELEKSEYEIASTDNAKSTE